MKNPILVSSLRLLQDRFGGTHFGEAADHLEAAFGAFVATPEAFQLAALNGSWARADKLWKTSMKRAAPAGSEENGA